MRRGHNERRRGHNEGSVYYWVERDRWVAEISISPGKRKKYLFKTQNEALRKKNEALRELEQGILATGPRQKLKDYLEDWLENVHKDRLRLSSYVRYKKHINYIIADLGNVWLQKLTPEQVRRFYTKMGNEGLSSKTINCIHGVFHLALENAVLWNYVPRNVCDLVKPPRIVSRKGTPLSPEQARQLVASARQHHLDAVLMVAVVTGMRRGELLALRWANVNFTNRTLVVIHTVDYIPHYGYVETESKTEAGMRTISLPSFLVDMLKLHQDHLLERRRKQGDKWENRDLVFPDLHGGYYNPNYLLRVLKKILQEAGIPHIPFHDLRHSAATILLSMGVNIKVIQELLGHSDIAITLRLYSHLLPPMQQEATDIWEKEFGEKEEDQDS